MAEVTGDDVQEQCGADQLSSGIKDDIEAAIHVVNDTFDGNSKNGWGWLLIDPKNAFSLSRVTTLWYTRVLWPRCSCYLFNSYRGWSTLLIYGVKESLCSQEGVTQGDPLSMHLYAVGLLPRIRTFKEPG